LTQFVQRIAAGEKFEAGQTIKGITTVDIKLIQAEPSEKETALRIIFPDANGHWPDDNRCNYVVAQQMHPHEKLWSFSRSTEK